MYKVTIKRTTCLDFAADYTIGTSDINRVVIEVSKKVVEILPDNTPFVLDVVNQDILINSCGHILGNVTITKL